MAHRRVMRGRSTANYGGGAMQAVSGHVGRTAQGGITHSKVQVLPSDGGSPSSSKPCVSSAHRTLEGVASECSTVVVCLSTRLHRDDGIAHRTSTSHIASSGGGNGTCNSRVLRCNSSCESGHERERRKKEKEEGGGGKKLPRLERREGWSAATVGMRGR